MGDATSLGLDDSEAVQLTGKIMMIAVLVLFLVVVFVLCLHLYAKWYWWNVVDDHSSTTTTTTRRRRRFVFAPGQDTSGLPALRRVLDPSLLKSLPIVVFTPQDFKDGLECAVCLSDLVQGEKARLLPKCNHGFHVECIDMWFQSHSTCPLCRDAVVPAPEAVQSSDSDVSSELSVEIPSPAETLASGFSLESPNFPTNVLFWGNQTRVSTGPGSGLEEGTSAQEPCPCPSSFSEARRPEGMLVIDIPSENPITSLASPSPSGNNRFAEEDLKSPVPTRLRSLKRLLSRDRRVSPCSPNSGGGDVEAGRAQS